MLFAGDADIAHVARDVGENRVDLRRRDFLAPLQHLVAHERELVGAMRDVFRRLREVLERLVNRVNGPDLLRRAAGLLSGNRADTLGSAIDLAGGALEGAGAGLRDAERD